MRPYILFLLGTAASAASGVHNVDEDCIATVTLPAITNTILLPQRTVAPGSDTIPDGPGAPDMAASAAPTVPGSAAALGGEELGGGGPVADASPAGAPAGTGRPDSQSPSGNDMDGHVDAPGSGGRPSQAADQEGVPSTTDPRPTTVTVSASSSLYGLGSRCLAGAPLALVVLLVTGVLV